MKRDPGKAAPPIPSALFQARTASSGSSPPGNSRLSAFRDISQLHSKNSGRLNTTVTASDIQELSAEGIIGPETCRVLDLPPAQLEQKRGRGRPKGLDDETQERIRMAAAFELCGGWSKRKMAPHILTDQPETAKSNIYRFYTDHGELIAAARQQLTEETARTMVSDRVKASQPPSKNS
jgi:hypothetical protein